MIRSKVGPSICSDDESDVDSKDDAAQEQSTTRVAIDKELLCRNPTLAKCGGEAQHLEKLGVGVLRDSRMFRVLGLS
jgi:hypothetical protein